MHRLSSPQSKRNTLVGALLACLLMAVACCRSLHAEVVVRVNAVRAGRAVVADVAGKNPIERQIRARLEPMLKVELSFVNRAAKLSGDERRALVAASVKWFDEFVVDFVKDQDRNQQQMWLQGMQAIMVGGEQTAENPRESIERGVAKIVAATLPQEKAAAYEEQRGRRALFYRDVTVANVVDCIDEELTLSSEQRAKITDSLTQHWNTDWAPQLEVFAMSSDMFPHVPEQWIRPVLNEAQLVVFNRLNRSSQRMIIDGRAFGMDDEVIDDVDLDDRPPAAENALPN